MVENYKLSKIMEKSRSVSSTSIDPVSQEPVHRFDPKKEDFQCTQFLGRPLILGIQSDMQIFVRDNAPLQYFLKVVNIV